MQETSNNCFGSKIVARPFFRRKQVSTSAEGTLLLLFGTRAYLFSPEEGSCYVFSTRNNCCEFLAFYGVVTQSVTQSFLKTPVCGASLSCPCAALLEHYSHGIPFGYALINSSPVNLNIPIVRHPKLML